MPSGVMRGLIWTCVVIGVAAIVHVVASASNGPQDRYGAERFARGELNKLTVLSNPPEQPDDAFQGPDGEPVRLSDFHGKVVLVNLWATWCPPCVNEMPTLAALQRARGGNDFVVLAVSVDEVPYTDKAKADLERLSGGDLTFYHDPFYVLPYDLQAPGFPTTILYDREGRELARYANEADWSSDQALALVDWAVARD